MSFVVHTAILRIDVLLGPSMFWQSTISTIDYSTIGNKVELNLFPRKIEHYTYQNSDCMMDSTDQVDIGEHMFQHPLEVVGSLLQHRQILLQNKSISGMGLMMGSVHQAYQHILKE